MSEAVATSSTAASVGPETLPKKLSDDAIIEAVCRLQFIAVEPPEIVIGRLSDEAKWKEYTHTRLPWADIPAPVRNADPNLRGEPIFSLHSADGSRVVRLAEQMLSYHLIGSKKYCGWQQFMPELRGAFETVFQKLTKPTVNKISFRYINAIMSNRHYIADMHELNLDVRVNSERLTGPINLNYITKTDTHVTTTRIAHPAFVQVQQGKLPDETVAIVDVEVSTLNKFAAENLDAVMNWVDEAHTLEKVAFFKLFPPKILATLREE